MATLELHLKTAGTELIVTSKRYCLEKILEAAFSLRELGAQPGEMLEFQLSVWKDRLPIAAMPQQGWLQMETGEPQEWQL